MNNSKRERGPSFSFMSKYCNDTNLKFDCVIGHNIVHKFPLHIHDSLCIGLITKGMRNLSWINKTEVIQRGEMFIVNINQPHAINQIHPHDYIAITVKGIPANIAFQNVVNSGECVRLFYQLLNEIKRDHSTLLFEKWTAFYNYLCNKWKMPEAQISDKNFLNKAITFIKENHKAPISVEDIAKHACMSKYHFSRLFKNLIGLSPHNYLLQYRLSKSYRFLQNNTPVFDTAIDSGFYDSSHFIKTFHTYMAVSPGEYQKSVLEQ